MPVRRQIPYSFGTFFITFTCRQWLHLIEHTSGYDMVYSWFDILRKEGHFVNGYTVMPNHLHCLLSFCKSTTPINNIVANGKRFMAYEILRRLRKLGDQHTLDQLRTATDPERLRSGRLHVVWQPSFDWKYCYSAGFALQKLDYMYDNPCRGKWNLCDSRVDYPHSSARFYAEGMHAAYPVTHVLTMNDIDLSRG